MVEKARSSPRGAGPSARMQEVAHTASPETTTANAIASLESRMRVPQRSLPPCGGGTGRGVSADCKSAVPFHPRLCLRPRASTTAYSQPFLLLMRDTDIAAGPVPAATPLPPPKGGRERWDTGVRNAKPALARLSFCIAFTSSRRCHLNRAGSGATKAIRPIHVLHIGLRMHIAAGRNRADHIGHREYRAIGAFAIEGSRKAIVAEL